MQNPALYEQGADRRFISCKPMRVAICASAHQPEIRALRLEPASSRLRVAARRLTAVRWGGPCDGRGVRWAGRALGGACAGRGVRWAGRALGGACAGRGVRWAGRALGGACAGRGVRWAGRALGGPCAGRGVRWAGRALGGPCAGRGVRWAGRALGGPCDGRTVRWNGHMTGSRPITQVHSHSNMSAPYSPLSTHPALYSIPRTFLSDRTTFMSITVHILRAASVLLLAACVPIQSSTHVEPLKEGSAMNNLIPKPVAVTQASGSFRIGPQTRVYGPRAMRRLTAMVSSWPRRCGR